MRPLKTLTAALTLACVTASTLVAQVAQERVNLSVVEQIREEGLERSQLDALARHLTDVIGPRLTGSPGLSQAIEWAVAQFESWGLENVVAEPWGEFGLGWERVSYEGRILTPFVEPLGGQPTAWTGSTDGTVRGSVLVIEADSAPDLERYMGRLQGAIVMMADMADVSPEFEQRPRRTSLETLLEPRESRGGGGSTQAQRQARAQRFAQFRRLAAIRNAVQARAKDEGVAAIIVPSSRQYGILRGGGYTPGRTGADTDPLPQLVISQEQYNHIYRNVTSGIPVEVELNIQNRFYDSDLNGYNVLAEIPGTDKADEYVMLGAHYDSWHMGTGATDNGAGSVVMMEAIRLLKTLGFQPRRTIRIALWSGEEQGLLGSRGWIQNHEELWPKISAYVNVDNGTGKIRGIWNQGNEAAVAVFEQILWPFRDLGVVAVRRGNTGGTDHLAFDGVGIPGFNFIQDPIEYGTRTHHTELDTYDHLMIEDLEQAAVVVAATVYHLAMRDEMMPREPQEEPASDGR